VARKTHQLKRRVEPNIHFPFLEKRKVLLVSHNLMLAGAPLLLAETAAAIESCGAEVALVNLGLQDSQFPLPAGKGFRIIPTEESFGFAFQADLIIANTAVTKTWVRALLSKCPNAGRKLIWWIHEIDTALYSGDMECLQQVAAVLFDSHASCDQWWQTGLPMPGTCRVIHPCVHNDFPNEVIRFRRASRRGSWFRRTFGRAQDLGREEIRTQLGVCGDDFLVTLVGQYCPHKGHDLLVKTIGQMLAASPGLPLKLLLVGFQNESVRHDFLRRLSQAEHASLGTERAILCTPNLKMYYLASDALIMNTQQPGEPFGRVTIEAMAFGLPVLGTRLGGTSEIVIDGVTGLLHPAGEEGQTQLADNIRVLMNDRSKTRTLGKAGFKRVRLAFTEDRFYWDLADILKGVLNRA
jgi:glycosyltransferase involved in cell wall biosynthesis